MRQLLPLVSVIIPTYNRPDFLNRTLQSILEQSYKNLQIIVVSNGCSLNNKSVVEALDDPRLEYYEQENSGGPASPRNHGIKKAKGKYIAFCDDDDLWMPDKTEKQVCVLEDNPKYGLSYTKMMRFNETNVWSIADECGGANFKSLLYKNTVPISSVFVRKNLMDKIGGFLESKVVGDSEDYEFVLRYALKTPFYFIDQSLIQYWSGENRTSCLDFKGSVTVVLVYIKTILNIYIITYRDSNISFFSYIKPAFFNIKNSLKTILYIFMRQLKLC